MKNIPLLIVVVFASCATSKNQRGPATSSLCIAQLIKTFKDAPQQNPPRSIYRYFYKNKTVFYVTPLCCDQFSDLYDENCKLLGHPDGGFTGKGDGLFIDFDEAKSAEKLIWKDDR